MSTADGIAVSAPAKINLALHVTGRRPDGYHDIETLAVFARFGDTVTVRTAEEDSFAVSGPFAASVPDDGTNLVVAARDALRKAIEASSPAAITLEKYLPVASGVGGGSSDAAAALKALAELWRTDLMQEELAAIGATLGADVPMCLKAQPLIATGIGERLTVLESFPALPLLLINPGVAVSTPAVFRALSGRANPPLPPPGRIEDIAGVVEWLRGTRNDLAAPAARLAPEIDTVLAALAKAGALFSRMSGSGATCFGLFESRGQAQSAAEFIAGTHPTWFVAETESMPSEA